MCTFLTLLYYSIAFIYIYWHILYCLYKYKFEYSESQNEKTCYSKLCRLVALVQHT